MHHFLWRCHYITSGYVQALDLGALVKLNPILEYHNIGIVIAGRLVQLNPSLERPHYSFLQFATTLWSLEADVVDIH